MNSVLEQHNEEQREYFESTLKRTMVPSATPYVRRQVAELLALAAPAPGCRLLEVGCGMGRYTFELVRRGYRVEGLDLSPVLLERLREYGGEELAEVPLHAMDVLAAPERLGGGFDGVVGFFTLHHLHDLEACCHAMAQLVRPGGKVVFLEPNPFNPLYYLQVLVTPRMTWKGDGGLVEMRRKRLAAAFTAAGLTDFQLERFGFFPPQLANRAWGRRLEAGIERFRWLSMLFPFQLVAARRP